MTAQELFSGVRALKVKGSLCIGADIWDHDGKQRVQLSLWVTVWNRHVYGASLEDIYSQIKSLLSPAAGTVDSNNIADGESAVELAQAVS